MNLVTPKVGTKHELLFNKPLLVLFVLCEPFEPKIMIRWEAQKLKGENLQVIWAKFSILSRAILLRSSASA
jgi:hypothetical protein